jgi:hypothetical protein
MVVILSNDDGKKMVERDELESFLEEYAYVTGVELTLVAAGERPDFVCEKRARRYGLEVVRAMKNPVDRRWDVLMGGEGELHGLDAAVLVQETLYRKESKRASAGWHFPKSTILVIQLIGSDGAEMSDYLDEQVMGEMATTGFREIWISDHSPIEPYGTVQLICARPKRWRGFHEHRFYGRKAYG